MIGQPKGRSLLVMSALAPISALQWEILRVRDESYCNFFIRNIKKNFFCCLYTSQASQAIVSLLLFFFGFVVQRKEAFVSFVSFLIKNTWVSVNEFMKLISPVDTTGNRLGMKMFHFFLLER